MSNSTLTAVYYVVRDGDSKDIPRLKFGTETSLM